MPLVPSPRVWSRFDKKLLSRVSKLLRESGHTIVQDDDFDSIALGMREGERDSIGSVSLSMSVLATVLAGAAFAIAAFDLFENLSIPASIIIFAILAILGIVAIWVMYSRSELKVKVNSVAVRILQDRMQRNNKHSIKIICLHCAASWKYQSVNQLRSKKRRKLIHRTKRRR